MVVTVDLIKVIPSIPPSCNTTTLPHLSSSVHQTAQTSIPARHLKYHSGLSSSLVQLVKMEVLKFLTHKLKAQSLNEVQPFQDENQEEEECDSGTESDEENLGLRYLLNESPYEQYSPCSPPILKISPSYDPPLAFSRATPTFSPTNPSMTRRPLQLVNHPQSPFVVVSAASEEDATEPPSKVNCSTGGGSTQESSDFERCSLDYEPGSSTEFERHSSEEELAIINNGDGRVSEKRKWAQAHRCSSCNDSSGSSDDEVRDLLANSPRPVKFSSSPPKGVQKLSRTMSPRLFFSTLPSSQQHTCSVSPRKRHRQALNQRSRSDLHDASVIHRPCLDFEKMQQIKKPLIFTDRANLSCTVKPCYIFKFSNHHC